MFLGLSLPFFLLPFTFYLLSSLWRWSLDDRQFQDFVIQVADVHLDIEGDLEQAALGIDVVLLIAQADGEGATQDGHVDVGVGEVLGQPLALVQDHVHVVQVLVHDDLLDRLGVALGQVEYQLDHG